MLFEACVDSVASALAAEAGGAGRLELCDGLLEGGVTPSAGKIRAVVGAVRIPTNVLIRPRGGDFSYDAHEMRIMLDDIAVCKAAGVAGVVLGVLLPDGTVDVGRTSQLVSAARPMSVTFHRAIDVTRDPLVAFGACMRLGVDRVLTSGHAATAIGGAAVIAAMVAAASEASSLIRVVAGGGVTAANAGDIVRLTGVTEVHGTGEHAVCVSARVVSVDRSSLMPRRCLPFDS